MKKNPALTVLVVIALLALAACGADEETRKKESIASQQLAYAFLRESQPSKALVELAKAEASHPNDPEIKNLLGLAYWAKREQAMAEAKFKEALVIDQNFSDAWNNLGALYLDTNRYDEAVLAFEKALKNVYYSTSERALANQGWALYKLGRLDEAKKKLTEATQVAPTFALAYKNLGLVLADMGDHAGAVANFDKVLRLYSLDQETHFARGASLLKLGDRAGAAKSFEEAYKLGPTTELGKSAKTYIDIMRTQ